MTPFTEGSKDDEKMFNIEDLISSEEVIKLIKEGGSIEKKSIVFMDSLAGGCIANSLGRFAKELCIIPLILATNYYKQQNVKFLSQLTSEPKRVNTEVDEIVRKIKKLKQFINETIVSTSDLRKSNIGDLISSEEVVKLFSAGGSIVKGSITFTETFDFLNLTEHFATHIDSIPLIIAIYHYKQKQENFVKFLPDVTFQTVNKEIDKVVKYIGQLKQILNQLEV